MFVEIGSQWTSRSGAVEMSSERAGRSRKAPTSAMAPKPEIASTTIPRSRSPRRPAERVSLMFGEVAWNGRAVIFAFWNPAILDSVRLPILKRRVELLGTSRSKPKVNSSDPSS